MPTRYASVDASGDVTGFYSSEVNATIPSGAIELTEAQYQQWLGDTTGFRWVDNALAAYTPPSPVLSPAQQAAAALLDGCQIVSTETPALNGTYAIDPGSQQKIMAMSLFIQVNGKFYGGATSYPWLDMSGAPHSFPTVAAFQDFASAIAAYVAALDLVIVQNSGSLPTQPVTIA